MRLEDKDVTPTFPGTVFTLIDSVLMNVNVCLPAKVDVYDSTTQYADVKIQLMKFYEGDSGPTEYAVIPNVPVKHPRAAGGAAFVHMPLVPGDDLVLVVSQRSLDNWKAQGGMTDPKDRRKFNLADAYALVGGSAIPDAFEVSDPTAVEIANTAFTRFKIKAAGKYRIEGGNDDELVKLINDLIASLARARTATSLGPEPLVDPDDPGFTEIAARAAAFQG